jgi:uncharacterized protein
MDFIRNHWKRIFIAMVLLAFPAAWYAVQWAGDEIASPPRRALMDYHQEFLTKPDEHGLRIESFTASDGTPCLVCFPAGKLGERGTKIRAQLAERGMELPAFGEIKGTLVLTHGRRGRKEDYLSIAERFCAAGFRCVIPDLPAHGDHPAKLATYGIREAKLPAMVLSEASAKFGFDPEPAGLMGMSMGGSVAIHSAALTDSPWRALVIVSSFDSFSEVIQGQAGRHAGLTVGRFWAQAAADVYQKRSGIALSDIQPKLRAASIHIPTLIAHGSADRVVPPAAGRRLFEALPASTTRKWLEIPGADHDNVLITPFPIYAEITEWMIRNVWR